jgi:hypothetical protein
MGRLPSRRVILVRRLRWLANKQSVSPYSIVEWLSPSRPQRIRLSAPKVPEVLRNIERGKIQAMISPFWFAPCPVLGVLPGALGVAACAF